MARKRNAGEGSVFQRSDGRWCAQLDLGWQGGRRQRKYLYGPTAAAVQDQLLKARNDHHQGLPVAVERQSVEQFLRDWLANTVKPSVRIATYVSYEHHIRNHIAPEIGRLPLRKLAPPHVRAMLNRKLASGLSARTVAYLRVVLRVALNQARKWNLVARNVAELVEPPRVERPRIEPLSPEQARALLDAVRGHRLEALYAVALACGLRMGEILGLRWRGDVDLEHGRMTISRSLQRQTGRGLVLTETKTDRSHRTIALPAPLVAALRRHRKRQLEERLAQGPNWQESGLVFASNVGSGLEPRNLHRAFKLMLGKAGLPDIRFHDLRHSAASLMLAQGVALRVVMETLGHSSISLTANTYSHVMPSLIDDAAEKMGALLFRD